MNRSYTSAFLWNGCDTPSVIIQNDSIFTISESHRASTIHCNSCRKSLFAQFGIRRTDWKGKTRTLTVEIRSSVIFSDTIHLSFGLISVTKAGKSAWQSSCFCRRATHMQRICIARYVVDICLSVCPSFRPSVCYTYLLKW